MTGSELNKNQLQQTVLLENHLSDSSLEDSERMENDVGAYHETRVDETVGALDSDSPASAFPCNDPAAASASDSVCEPDNQHACKRTTVTRSEILKEQIESSSGLKCNISYPENPSTAMYNANSSIHDTLDESLEPSVKYNTVKANGESNPASFSATLVNDDPSVQSDPYLDQPTLPIKKSSPNSFVEASTDAKTDVTRGIVDSSTSSDTSDDKMNDLSPSCTKENVKVSGVQSPSV